MPSQSVAEPSCADRSGGLGSGSARPDVARVCAADITVPRKAAASSVRPTTNTLIAERRLWDYSVDALQLG